MITILEKKKKNQVKKTMKCNMKKLKTIGNQLLTSRAHINNLPILLKFVTHSSHPHYALESIITLRSFFTPLLPNLPRSSTNPGNPHDPETIYHVWVRSKFDEFVKLLIDLSMSLQSEQTLREFVLDTIMEIVKLGNGGQFQSSIYNMFIHCIVLSSLSIDFLLESLASKYFKYIDIRYFTYISLEKLSRNLEAKDISDNRPVDLNGNTDSYSRASIEHSIRRLYYILSHIPPLEALDDQSSPDMWSVSGDSNEALKTEVKQKDKPNKSSCTALSSVNIAKKMKLKFTKAWLAFLRLPLPLDVYKEVLVCLPHLVIPHLANPIILCDFLTRSYDIGSVISVMSLSSLFILMTQYAVEYPNFYEKLYALLVPPIFMEKHRAKFFQLLDSCLKSPLLPAYLAAAFTKKLSRLALSIPPSGSLIVIALIHNLLRRHPSINFLVHREDVNEITKADPENSSVDIDMTCRRLGIDHFKDEESNPMKSDAMKSSLWEIDTLRHHWCPPVSRFVLSLEEDLRVRAKTTEVAVSDFCDGSYATIFREEIRRRVKQVPLAFYKTTPVSLFSETDFSGWSFKCEEPNARDDQNSKRQKIECC